MRRDIHGSPFYPLCQPVHGIPDTPWFAAWLLGFDWHDYRQTYQVLFIVLLGISMVFFILASWRPARIFRKRMAAIYGGIELRSGLERQRRLASDDLKGLDKDDPAFHELQAFIADKSTDPTSSMLMRPLWVNGMLCWQAFMLLAAIAVVGLRLGAVAEYPVFGVDLPIKQQVRDPQNQRQQPRR